MYSATQSAKSHQTFIDISSQPQNFASNSFLSSLLLSITSLIMFQAVTKSAGVTKPNTKENSENAENEVLELISFPKCDRNVP